MGANNRLAGIVSASMCGIALLFGNALIAFLPKFVVGGALLFLGFGLLFDWVYLARTKLSWRDYLFMLCIFIVISIFGFLEGVFCGVLVATVLFGSNP